MGLLTPAKNMTAYGKIGIMGFAGSGKTYTATDIAIGLAKKSEVKKIAFFDTEKGSDFCLKKCQDHEIELLTLRGRAFAQLLEVIKECEANKIPVLIIDSISHVWRDLTDSYLKKSRKQRLSIGDWGILKGQWGMFTDAFLNSQVHIIMCGRAGFEYDFTENEDGKKEMVKSGTKMRVEGETGFEPDLLIEMERQKTSNGNSNIAYVLKDRSDTMNGKTIKYPTFSSFQSFFEYINIGGEHQGVDVNSDSTSLFNDPDRSFENLKKNREIALEELNACLVKFDLAGTAQKTQKERIAILEEVFSTSSKRAIEELYPEQIRVGIEKIKEKFLPKDEISDHVEQCVKEAQEVF